jgi:hypothetical protein
MGTAQQESDPGEKHNYLELNLLKSRRLGAMNTRLMDGKVAPKLKTKKGFTNLEVNTWEQVLTKM